MKVRLYATLVMLLGALAMHAQDIHFSQFYAAPLTLNPALTGNFNGLYRITGIYRLQYPGLTQGKPAFSTPSLGVDFSLLKNKLKDGALGLGLVFINDQQNGKTFNSNYILASVGYNMTFGPKKKLQLGAGLQGGIITTKVDFSQLQFDNGFYLDNNGNLQYNNSNSGESFSTPKMKGAFNAGIFVKYEFIKTIRVYAGYSFNNATHYKDNFLANSPAFDIPFRHTIHGGFEFDLSDKAVLIPGILYQNEAMANETEFGLTVGIHVVKSPEPAKRATVYFGLWNRLNTGNYTIIPKVGLEYKCIRAGFAYDNNLRQGYKGYSKYDTTTGAGGVAAAMPQAFEITLSYIGNLVIRKEDHYLFNPRY